MSRRLEMPIVHEADALQPCHVCNGKADRLALYLGEEEGRIQHYHWRPMCRGCFFSYLKKGLCLGTARLYREVKGVSMEEARRLYG